MLKVNFLYAGRPSSGISLDPRPYSGRYLGRSGSPRFGQNAVGPLSRLRPESGSSGERSPGVKIPNVEVSFKITGSQESQHCRTVLDN